VVRNSAPHASTGFVAGSLQLLDRARYDVVGSPPVPRAAGALATSPPEIQT
jgi:hypothetical protein